MRPPSVIVAAVTVAAAAMAGVGAAAQQTTRVLYNRGKARNHRGRLLPEPQTPTIVTRPSRSFTWNKRKRQRVLRAAFGGRVPKVRRVGSYCAKRSR